MFLNNITILFPILDELKRVSAVLDDLQIVLEMSERRAAIVFTAYAFISNYSVLLSTEF